MAACTRSAKAASALTLCWAGWLCMGLGHAQTTDAVVPTDGTMALVGGVFTATCQIKPMGNGTAANVVSLPGLLTTTFRDNVFGPVTVLKLAFSRTISDCPADLSTAPQMVFDSDAATVVPRSGLLRNTASDRPAQNVYIQIGLVNDTEGSFVPIDLNQPYQLNQALVPQKDGSLLMTSTVTLGIRYVAARFVPDTLASLSNPGVAEVTDGNVSVYLPFVVNVK